MGHAWKAVIPSIVSGERRTKASLQLAEEIPVNVSKKLGQLWTFPFVGATCYRTARVLPLQAVLVRRYGGVESRGSAPMIAELPEAH